LLLVVSCEQKDVEMSVVWCGCITLQTDFSSRCGTLCGFVLNAQGKRITLCQCFGQVR
jgi:hypothetical protein